MNNYPLGKNQLAVLDAMRTFEVYFKGCEWVYLYHSDTVETLEALYKRGLVRRLFDTDLGEGVTKWFLTETGQEMSDFVNQFQKMDINIASEEGAVV